MIPVSNMFHVMFKAPKEKVEKALIQLNKETGIGISGNLREYTDTTCYCEISIGDLFAMIPDKVLEQAFALLDDKMKEI
ncbi:hypothetical protein D3C75_1190740 [compost metagenome]